MTSQSLQELEQDIERSRAQLDQTIDRLQDKMTVSGVVDDMLGTARSGRYAPLFDNVLETVRRNPVPVMLMAMGIGLLAYRLGRRTVVAPRTAVLDAGDAFAADDTFADDQDWADEVEDMRLQRAATATSDLPVAEPLPSSDDVFEPRPRTTVGSRL